MTVRQVAVLSYQTWRGRFDGDPHTPGPKDSSRSQALRDHRRDTARIRIPAGSWSVEPGASFGYR